MDTAPPAGGDDDFGRYRVLRVLGEGGMGTVYLAEQFEPVRRRVALKVVNLGMDTSQVLTRFHNERQALAMWTRWENGSVYDTCTIEAAVVYFWSFWSFAESIT